MRSRRWRESKSTCQKCSRFILKPTYSIWYLFLCSEKLNLLCEALLRKLHSSIIRISSQNPTLSSGSHMGNQTLPFISLFPSTVWKMCAGASAQCEITPLGGQRKGSQPKIVPRIPPCVPSFVMTPLQIQAYRSVVCFTWCTLNPRRRRRFKLSSRKDVVAFGIVFANIPLFY